jgi:hypothetical protein
VLLFPKPGPRCDRKQRNKLKSRILTDAPIRDRSEKETVGRTAIKKEYCKEAKSLRYEI